MTDTAQRSAAWPLCRGRNSAEAIAIEPGSERHVGPAGIVLARGRPLISWCAECWAMRWGATAAGGSAT